MSAHVSLGPFTEPAIFAWFKERADSLMKSEEACATLDNGIVPVLQYLNRDENLATVFSCTGHPERDAKDTYHDSFYVMASVLANKGLERLYRLRDAVNAFQESPIAFELLSLEHIVECRRELRLSLTSRCFARDTFDTWYPAWILSGHIPSPSKGGVLHHDAVAYRDALFAYLGHLLDT